MGSPARRCSPLATATMSLLTCEGLGVAMPHGRASARAAAKVVATDGDPESALARAVDLVAAGFADSPPV
jgi:hypothetical protein